MKAIVLVAVGAAALSLLHPQWAELFKRWAHALQLQTHRRFVQELLIKAVAIQKPCRDVVVVGAVPKGLGDEP